MILGNPDVEAKNLTKNLKIHDRIKNTFFKKRIHNGQRPKKNFLTHFK